MNVFEVPSDSAIPRGDILLFDICVEGVKQNTDIWITDLFGYHNMDEKGFVITLESADKVVVLKAVGEEGWRVYKTTSKG